VERNSGASGRRESAFLTLIKAVAKSINSLAGWVKGVAAAITAVTAVLIFFFPGCEPAKPCRGTLEGALISPSVDQSVRYRSYLDLTGAKIGQASQDRLDEVGKLIDFGIHAQGYKNKPLRVSWWLLTAGGEPVADPRLRDQLGVVVRPQECADQARQKIWAGPIPATSDKYLVEIRLVNTNGSELDRIRTPAFRGLG
jgi:hypothetical protein